ncbi:OmpA domain protein [Arcticibacter svalbardensis MN12-7]|uniref:OmpA domain protein n=1 Tax=Arcticibacter svalbardensis MN12-7 TaxID=1150600 RepID=R9GUM0_9SPHI|nr:OmpA family protein [Arcticibacter svalbardensis]EOR95388.1 OmpA domain protein [Arcticibacter svalbardensis MN12-7]
MFYSHQLLLTGFFVIYSLTIDAQQPEITQVRSAKQAYEQAGSHIRKKQYSDAITLLQKAIQEDPHFASAYQQLGDIYRLTEAYTEAKTSYESVLKINPNFNSLTFYGLAISNFYSGNYAEALPWFTKYAQSPKLTDKSKLQIEKYILDCEYGMDAVRKPVHFDPINLGASINTPNQEYFPSITADNEQIIFTRRTKNNEDFYESEKTPKGWKPATSLSSNINTEEYNEGAQCISPDGIYLFFTACNRPDGQGSCDIYLSKKNGKDWSVPYNPGYPLNTDAWESQPALNADGKRLYFVSNRKGGYGGNDIWCAELKPDGGWSEPKNLGPNINTPYDEHSPYIHPDNRTLYFSSEGWPGLGKQDIFMSVQEDNGQWKQPTNLGYPINTAKEQSGFMVSTDGNTAYYSSDIKGGYGGMDIYSFQLNEAFKPKKVTYVKGSITDFDTQKALSAQVTIVDLKTGKPAFEDDEDNNGKFLATLPQDSKYGLTIFKKGYMVYSENLALETQNDRAPFILDVKLKPIKVQEEATLKNIFFDTDKFSLLPESKSDLAILIRFLNENSTVSIEINGHTDNVGTDKINLLLSENRAKEVYNYLIGNNIKASRLSYKGYGKSLPIADNLTEKGRQLNRRTAFIIKSIN